MRHLFFTLIALALLGTGIPTSAQQRPATGNQRVALVIGIDSYAKLAPLRNARADARAMAQSLERAGYRVMLKLDTNERSMKEAIRTFKTQLAGGGAEAIFFYSGHGVQLGGANYLLPTDIDNDNEDQVKDGAISLQRILDDMQEQKARFSLAIIDACRNNPFRSAGRSIGGTRGLAATTAASGQMVLFSAGAGQLALDRVGDRDTNPNGLFTRIFLKEMEKPGVPVDQMLRSVREEVVQIARSIGHDQTPALYDQAVGRFYIRQPGAGAQVASIGQETTTRVDPLQVEMMFWDSIKSSTSAEDFEAYKSRFPNGQFVGLAENRIRALSQPKPAPVQAPIQVAVAPSSTQSFVSSSRPAQSSWTPRAPVRIVVPFAAGGATDMFARLLAQDMSSSLGQAVIVENRPGASGIIGADVAARSPADGQTLLFTTSNLLTMLPSLTRTPFNESDFSPIAQFGSLPMALVTSPSIGSLRDALSRQQGTYATAGNGTPDHVMMELFKSITGVAWLHVPYKGSAPALVDLLGGQINSMLTSTAFVIPHIRAGKLRAHGVTGNSRLNVLADVPTFSEQGVRGLNQTSWVFLAAPRSTPSEIVARYYHEVARTVGNASVRQRANDMGAMLFDMSPSDVTNLIRTESSTFGNVIRSAGIRID